jgi:hypothetical protein
VQQRRHAIPTDKVEHQQPAGRALTSSASKWSLYEIKGSVNPLKIADAGQGVQLQSNESLGVFWQRIAIDTSREPVLAWQWRVSRVFEESSPWLTDTDNFPARVLVGFDASWDDADSVALSFKKKVEDATGESPPSRAICYTFGGSLSSREAVDGSFGSGRVGVINLRNGSSKTGQWFREMRDIQSDYESIFQLKAPAINMIGIACDTNLVGGTATADFKGFTMFPPSARRIMEHVEEPNSVGGSNWRFLWIGLCSLAAVVVGAIWFRKRVA